MKLKIILPAIFALTGILVAKEPLMVYCGAGIRPPMEEIGKRYEDETGIKVQYVYGGSAQLLAQIELTKKGDLFLPGEEFYIDIAAKKGLITDVKETIAYWVPVILVQKGNPKQIKGLEDLIKEGIRVGVGDERICAIGMITEKIFIKNKMKDEVEKNIIVRTSTAPDLGNALKLKSVDTVIIFDSIAELYKDAGDITQIPIEQNEPCKIVIGILKSSLNKEESNKYLKYLKGEKGVKIFKKHHYKTSLNP